MSKISIKSVLKSSNDTHIFKGKGLKKDNKIIYNDDGIQMVITLDDIVWLERKKDYHIKLGFKTNTKTLGTYIIHGYSFKIETETKKLNIEENRIKVNYSVNIDNVFIDNFELNVEYSIDS